MTRVRTVTDKIVLVAHTITMRCRTRHMHDMIIEGKYYRLLIDF